MCTIWSLTNWHATEPNSTKIAVPGDPVITQFQLWYTVLQTKFKPPKCVLVHDVSSHLAALVPCVSLPPASAPPPVSSDQ